MNAKSYIVGFYISLVMIAFSASYYFPEVYTCGFGIEELLESE